MYDQLETELFDAFSQHANEIPSESGARLRSIDYHPRSSRVPLRAVGAAAGAAATTGAVISIVVLGGSQAAFAGWTPTPTSGSSGQEATAGDNCRTQLATSTVLWWGSASITGPASPLSAIGTGSGWTIVDSDIRGPYTVSIYKDGSADATCFTGPSFTVASASDVTGTSTSSSMRVSVDQAPGSGSGVANGNSVSFGGTGLGSLLHYSVAHLESTSQGPYTLVTGQVASGVSAVTLVRSDGEDVQASTAGGLFVAWWPGTLDPTSAEVTTPSGTSTETMNLVSQIPPPGGTGKTCRSAPQTTSVTMFCDAGPGN